MKKLIQIQSELKAPKNQRNTFGKYNYRSCEDILEAVKPLLLKHGCTLTITDEIKEVGGLVFVESTAVLRDIEEKDLLLSTALVKAQAGINPDRKGMDIAQSFGSSSSYARKYALNGLFLIDDTKEIDSVDNTKKVAKVIDVSKDKKALEGSKDLKELGALWTKLSDDKKPLLLELKDKLKLTRN